MQSQLPAWLSQAIDLELHGVSGKALAAEYAKLSLAYREGKPSRSGADPRMYWLSYLLGRMPATYAAVQAALRQIPASLLSECESLLDLGSGPGTAIWAACNTMHGLKSAHGIEHNDGALALAEKLAALAPLKPTLEKGAMPGAALAAPEADLVILAYSAGEAGEAAIDAAWAKTRKVLLIVEPGTPAGFKVILGARKKLFGLVAPCPQRGDCPLAIAPEIKWCHFSARLERTRMAKQLKGGELGYEDEKFSYAAFSKIEAALAPSRIIGYPKKTEGRVVLDLCAPSGLLAKTLTKSQKAAYKVAKKAAWGDAFDMGAPAPTVLE